VDAPSIPYSEKCSGVTQASEPSGLLVTRPCGVKNHKHRNRKLQSGISSNEDLRMPERKPQNLPLIRNVGSDSPTVIKPTTFEEDLIEVTVRNS
jgi:hypothetical protein